MIYFVNDVLRKLQ